MSLSHIQSTSQTSIWIQLGCFCISKSFSFSKSPFPKQFFFLFLLPLISLDDTFWLLQFSSEYWSLKQPHHYNYPILTICTGYYIIFTLVLEYTTENDVITDKYCQDLTTVVSNDNKFDKVLTSNTCTEHLTSAMCLCKTHFSW